ncbi:MAG: tetratricopeptide repeat protein [Myxococcales bacterium]|nr:tetratricopeptide repeat protein [Myxococcales bacterium]
MELEDRDPVAAIDAYRRSLRLRPDTTEAWINLGRLFAESGDADAAHDCFRSALDLDPADATAYYNLGVIAQDAGKEADAIALYHRALELDPQLALRLFRSGRRRLEHQRQLAGRVHLGPAAQVHGPAARLDGQLGDRRARRQQLLQLHELLAHALDRQPGIDERLHRPQRGQIAERELRRYRARRPDQAVADAAAHRRLGQPDQLRRVPRRVARPHRADDTIHAAAVAASSSITSPRDRPERTSTSKPWSAPSTTCSVARAPSCFTTGVRRGSGASSSRVPWRNSSGPGACARCSARSVPGLSGGCSGKPKNTRPRQSGSGSAACAREVIRPPKLLPPANRGRSGAVRAASAHAARTAASATAGASGRALPAAMYGNSQRSVEMPCAASAPARSSRNGCRIPAPAPCARTSSARAASGRRRITRAAYQRRRSPTTSRRPSRSFATCTTTGGITLPSRFTRRRTIVYRSGSLSDSRIAVHVRPRGPAATSIANFVDVPRRSYASMAYVVGASRSR